MSVNSKKNRVTYLDCWAVVLSYLPHVLSEVEVPASWRPNHSTSIDLLKIFLLRVTVNYLYKHAIFCNKWNKWRYMSFLIVVNIPSPVNDFLFIRTNSVRASKLILSDRTINPAPWVTACTILHWIHRYPTYCIIFLTNFNIPAFESMIKV